ncbi:MAG: hypothetical protein HC917_20990 [Richelia sp. SM2_1_7]|nr:hypothetical protein [Richelia sp. SM2_1_7]
MKLILLEEMLLDLTYLLQEVLLLILVADVRSTFGASLPVGTFNLASGQNLGIFLGA